MLTNWTIEMEEMDVAFGFENKLTKQKYSLIDAYIQKYQTTENIVMENPIKRNWINGMNMMLN